MSVRIDARWIKATLIAAASATCTMCGGPPAGPAVDASSAADASSGSKQAAPKSQPDFGVTVEATHPLAYYRLDATTGKSEIGSTQYKSLGGVTTATPGATNAADDRYLKLDGHDGYIVTTQKGGVGTAASLMAWVDLEQLPSKADHFFYVIGESQGGNDLDVQFETDDKLKFYTAGGSELTFVPPPATLIGQWHLIVVTLDTVSKARVIYWDGNAVANDQGGGEANKTSLLSMGASTVFGGRFFNGGIEQAALWNRALTAAEVSGIYAADTSGKRPE